MCTVNYRFKYTALNDLLGEVALKVEKMSAAVG